MAIQSGSTIYASDVDSYLDVTKGNLIYASDVDSYLDVTKGNLIYANDINKIIEILTRPRIGGKIFYDAGDNGATYTFYDSNGNVVSDTSISGLQSAVSYTINGTPSFDRFYAVYPKLLNNERTVLWGFYHNVDIKSSGGNIVNTGEGIGAGKTATQAILNYIDTYASNETANSNKPKSDISQASHNGYNLYKNSGSWTPYLWDIIRDVNNNSLEGHNDWFIPSSGEMMEIAKSKVVTDITIYGHNYLWLSSAHSSSEQAGYYNYYYAVINYNWRDNSNPCIACRAF